MDVVFDVFSVVLGVNDVFGGLTATELDSDVVFGQFEGLKDGSFKLGRASGSDGRCLDKRNLFSGNLDADLTDLNAVTLL